MSEQGKSIRSKEAVPPEGEDKRRIAELEKRLREMEQELRVANGKLQMALEMGKLTAWERDVETDRMTGTPAFFATFGLPPDAEPTFAELEKTFHPADVERVRQAIIYGDRTNTHFNIDQRIIKPDGRITRILVRGGGIYENGRPIRYFGVLQDVSEREKIKEAAQDAHRRQEFLLSLNDQLASLNNPTEIMETAARNLAILMKVDSVGYSEVYTDRNLIVVEREWSKGAISNEGQAFPFDIIPRYQIRLMHQGESIIIEDVASDPNYSDPLSQSFYRTANVRSALAASLLRNGKLTATLYAACSEPRSWSSDDIALVEDVAERTWLAIEKARAEIGLRETEARFRIIAESLPALVWILDTELRLTYTNDRWLAFSGLPSSEALGESWTHWVHPEDLARVVEEVKIVRQNRSGYSTEMRYRSAEGIYRWHMIQAAPLFSTSGELKGWCGTSVDIHDLKETEAALRESEERLALAQRAARIGVFDWDVPGGTITWMPEQEKLFEIEAGSFEGTYEGWSSRVHPADVAKFEREYQEAIARGDQELPFAYRIPLLDGSFRHIEGRMVIFYGPDNSPARIIGVNIDVTKHKQAEHRQQLLIRELHHRVKNTLATVQAIVGSTARTASSIDEFYQGFVGRIVSLSRTHNLLTEDLWQKAALEDLIQTELGPYEDGARNRISVEGPHVELPSEAAVPIGMAIHELTTNAAKHGALSTFGGQVEVRWRVEPGEERPVLHFTWTEHGGPKVSTPTRQGFGSRLLQRVLATQLQADVSMDFPEEGLRFTMTLPIPGAPPIFNPDQ
jgi:PAS domain S-box-containing protein